VSSGEIRCSRCANYKEVWHPQPGVNWDRCKARRDSDGDLVSCARNNERNCLDFKRALIFIPRCQDSCRPYW
jgi:hypothetical protein